MPELSVDTKELFEAAEEMKKLLYQCDSVTQELDQVISCFLSINTVEKRRKTKMKVQELFPIGSVVKLRNGIRPLMIFGIKQTNLETNEEYDYIGVLYPEGNMGDKTQFLFNHEDIEEVISKGYTDETWEDFIKRMREFYKEI